MAENKYAIQEFIVIPVSGLTSIDLIPGIIGLEYYEDILSPTITAKVLFSATEILTKDGSEEVKLVGGEIVSFDILVPDFENLNIENMVIRSVSADKTGRQGLYVLELVSKESVANETTRIVKKFNQPISDIVKEIIMTLKTTKEIKIDKTFNLYNFVATTKRPFETIIWLCPKSVPQDMGTPGFFFYETQDGYNFLSANNLLVGGGGEYKQKYSQKENRENPGDEKNNFKILSSGIQKNNDIMTSLRSGMYSNESLFYNAFTQEFTPIKFTLKEKFGTTTKTIADSSSPKLPDKLEDTISRISLKMLDPGALTAANKFENEQDLPKYQAESAVRYSLLYSQVLNIIIPCNTDLRAGQLIECEIPRSSSLMKDRDMESTASGKYVIASLCHRFDPNRKAFTSLSLIKDSYEFITT
jgi:hypothetical protein